jgi:DNA segregation ATPase FtsK/SpoIIIE-like protein
MTSLSFTDPKRAAVLLVVGLAATAALLYLWWPAGIVVGGTAGVLAVAQIGLMMQRAASEQPLDEVLEEELVTGPVAVQESGVRGDLERLKAELGDAWPDFARAARLVVSTQYASAARLQRELQVPYSRARRILDGLEHEHFVGPKTGSLPRQVLLPKERLPEVERLFAGV